MQTPRTDHVRSLFLSIHFLMRCIFYEDNTIRAHCAAWKKSVSSAWKRQRLHPSRNHCWCQGVQTECGLGILDSNINFWSIWWSQPIPIFLNYSSPHWPLFPLKRNTLKSRGNYGAVVESYLQSLASCVRSFSISKPQFSHLQNGYRNITTSKCCCEQ